MEAKFLLNNDEFEFEDEGNVESGSNLRLSTSMHKVRRRIENLRLPTKRRIREFLSSGIGRLFSIDLLPRFLQAGGLAAKKNLHTTSYLDALRGYAALIVLNHHFARILPESWTEDQWAPYRFLVAGTAMVDVFFVISGYVLSQRMLKLMRTRNQNDLLQCLASSTFRRYLRLFGSSIIAALVAFILVRLDWYRHHSVQRYDDFLPQFLDFVGAMLSFANPFADLKGYVTKQTLNSKYLAALWTIPVEYRGSMVVFAFCTATCKLSTRHRMAACWVLISICYYWRAIYVSLFMYGLFAADLSMDRQEQSPSPESPRLPGTERVPRTRMRRIGSSIATSVGYGITFLMALILLSQPHRVSKIDNPPWPWNALRQALPPKWPRGLQEHPWLSIGAFLLVLSLDNLPVLQRPLQWGFSQYLGELSFGIYAMHWCVQFSLVELVLVPWRESLGESLWTYGVVYFVHLFFVFTAADYFTRVDKRVVKFGRWLEKKTFAY